MSNVVETTYGALESYAKGRVPLVKHTSKTTLVVNGMMAADAMAAAFYNCLQSMHMRDLPETLSVERIGEAFNALVYLRVQQVNNTPCRACPEVWFKDVQYPAVLFPLLRALGNVENADEAYSVKLEVGPGLKRFAEANYDWEKVVATLQDLDAYGTPNGLEIAIGLPKARDGNIAVVALWVANDRISSANSAANPADLIIRSALDFSASEYIWGTLRWEYGGISEYQAKLGVLVRSAFRSIR